MDTKKIIKTIGYSVSVFKTVVFAYKVYRHIPKFDKIDCVDTDKFIENVNSRFSETD